MKWMDLLKVMSEISLTSIEEKWDVVTSLSFKLSSARK